MDADSKILRQTILFPEKRNLAVSEYKRLKTTIAKKWLQSDLGVVELIPNNKQEQEIAAGYIDLKVTLAYGEWGLMTLLHSGYQLRFNDNWKVQKLNY